MGYLGLAFLSTLSFLMSPHAGEKVLWFGLTAFNLSAWMSLKAYPLLSFVVFSTAILLMLSFAFWNQGFKESHTLVSSRFFRPIFSVSCCLMAVSFLIWPPLDRSMPAAEAFSVHFVVLFLIALGYGSVVLIAGLNLAKEEESP